MGLDITCLRIIKQIAKKIGAVPQVLAFGYPDLLITDDEYKLFFGESFVLEDLKVRDDSEKIIRWHGRQNILTKIYDTYGIFEAIGCELVIADVKEIRGGELVLDLNFAVEHEVKYDLVYDGGTIEHCFNIGQAMQNMTYLTKVGGYILHVNPLNMINHGFYNLSPTFYYDYYIQNFHALCDLRTLKNGVLSDNINPTKRFFLDSEHVILCVAQKKNEKHSGYPMQAKYRD